MPNPLTAEALGEITAPPLSTFVVLGIAVGVALFSAMATRLTQGEDAMRKTMEMTRWRKKLFEAKRAGDKKTVAKLERKKDYYNQLSASLSMKRMKTSFVTIIPILAVFYLMSVFVFKPISLDPLIESEVGRPPDNPVQVGVSVARLPQLSIPFISDSGVAHYEIDGVPKEYRYLDDIDPGPVMGYYWWYFLVYLMASSLLGRALKTSPAVWEEEMRAEESSKDKKQKKN